MLIALESPENIGNRNHLFQNDIIDNSVMSVLRKPLMRNHNVYKKKGPFLWWVPITGVSQAPTTDS